MNEYRTRIERANFEGVVAGIRSDLHSLATDLRAAVDEVDEGLVDRVETVLDHVLTVTAAATPELVPKRWLDDLITDLQTCAVSAAEIAGAGEANQLQPNSVSALAQATEEVAAELIGWPYRPPGDDWREAVTQAASTYRRSFGQQLLQLTAEIDQTKSRLHDLRTGLVAATAEQDQAIEARLAEFDEQLAAIKTQIDALDAQQATADNQISKAIARSDQAIATHQEQFANAQEKRSADFHELVDDIVTNAQLDFDAQREAADGVIAALRAKMGETEELVAVFAAAGTANAFDTEAKEQGKVANTWRLVAIGLAVVAGLAAVSLFFGRVDNGVAWDVIVGKVLLSVALGGVASYAARQSGHHRRREEFARKQALNIATFGPLTRELEIARQADVRERVIEGMFTQEHGGSSRSGRRSRAGTAISEDQVNLIGRLLEVFRRAE